VRPLMSASLKLRISSFWLPVVALNGTIVLWTAKFSNLLKMLTYYLFHFLHSKR
jgi:hypothetical protein